MMDGSTYPFLLHQFRRRGIVTDIFAEGGNREVPINIGGANFGHVAIENEVVAVRPKANCMLFPNQDEREAITVLNRPVLMLHDSKGSRERHTFSRYLKKNLKGSAPYSRVEPMRGNQEKTSGGWFLLLKRSRPRM
jgi:hypothetical protein